MNYEPRVLAVTTTVNGTYGRNVTASDYNGTKSLASAGYYRKFSYESEWR